MSIAKTLDRTISVSPERAQEASTDMTIVRRVQEGEVAAFDTLILKYRERIYSVIYNLTGNREDTSDLTQDTFIKAFQSINRFKANSSFFTWLYRIAVNTTLTFLRKNKLRRFLSFEKISEDGESAEVIDALVTKSHSDRDALRRELQEKLNEAFQRLSLSIEPWSLYSKSINSATRKLLRSWVVPKGRSDRGSITQNKNCSHDCRII